MAQTAAKPTKKTTITGLGIIVMGVNLVIGILFYIFVAGSDSNFTADGKPIPGNYLALVHEGGFIVPILLALFLTVMVFFFERLMTISKAKGNGSIESFLQKIKFHLSNQDMTAALKECDRQKGSVANVVNAGLHKYAEMKADKEATTEQKVLNISKEIEEATADNKWKVIRSASYPASESDDRYSSAHFLDCQEVAHHTPMMCLMTMGHPPWYHNCQEE